MWPYNDRSVRKLPDFRDSGPYPLIDGRLSLPLKALLMLAGYEYFRSPGGFERFEIYLEFFVSIDVEIIVVAKNSKIVYVPKGYSPRLAT
jgi:hypothetical protein